MHQIFSLNDVRLTFIQTNNDVLMNAARYQARLIKSRPLSPGERSSTKASMVRFCLLMAHVVDTDHFPFAVPDPFAHPETVGLAWDAYMNEDPALWDSFSSAIDMPTAINEEIQDRLQNAMEEMDAVSAHTISPFKRKRDALHRK